MRSDAISTSSAVGATLVVALLGRRHVGNDVEDGDVKGNHEEGRPQGSNHA